MNLIDKTSGKILQGNIEILSKAEIKDLFGHENFTFDWSIEKENDVYKIYLKEEDEILGLMSIIDILNEFRIYINLIESAISHRGKEKTILNIPGCLIAFACKLAFLKGYDGFISLTPKTVLRKYYSETYGFIPMGTQMAIFGKEAYTIIQKYLEL